MAQLDEHDISNDRRKFLKFAAITPPAVTFLLSTSLSSKAIAKSGGGRASSGKPGNGWGDSNHEHEGPPGQTSAAGSSSSNASTKSKKH